MNLPKTLQLVIDSASMKRVWVKSRQGDYVKKGVNVAATHELCRPPFVLSAPEQKKEWSQAEVETFYQNNPVFKV